MEKFLRRFFPTRPYLGATLVTVMLLQTAAIAQMAGIVPMVPGTGEPKEGAWMVATPDNQIPEYCTYKHNPDWYETSTRPNLYKFVDQHVNFCTTPEPTGGCPTTNPIQKPAGCAAVGGSLRQDHIFTLGN